ncbi:MAG: Nif3-like dinuclear metal center hexameric protein [Zoogloeaceae bacterium]|jgi:dinuclear metal center YbgI/SA1388 family protein|nr:Nif3-like dinuclear metal center hexameric protein [Zoogloeaceae bacterium]
MGRKKMAVSREKFRDWLATTLGGGELADYCPNGLQVEGAPLIRRVVLGVTASQALIDEAIARKADALIVHHGLFWRGDPYVLEGWRKRRVAALLRHNINLFAYHLPLDAHPELGNNARWAAAMGWEVNGHFGEQNLACLGEGPEETLAVLTAHIAQVLGREPLVIGDWQKPIKKIAWCSGAAQDGLEDAARLGADAYLSGEISERTTHLARETGTAYLACGHHATERFGVLALAGLIKKTFGLSAHFVDIDNPV